MIFSGIPKLGAYAYLLAKILSTALGIPETAI
jgi:hypothetical protein